MARSIAELNIRIGARIDEMVKGLNNAERRLQRSGRKLARLGNEISLSLSAPLALAGVGALKTNANFQRLRDGITTAMKDAGASTEETRAEIEALRKESLKPGLNFEQALTGSIRLQSVKIEAELARRTLGAFGNALSLAGKKAQELDGITLALTQMKGKGKIAQEELNQLFERVPQISNAIQNAFGVADAEGLRKLGVDVDTFINKTVSELEKLPTATGGLSNALENSASAVKNFLDSIGADIDRTFDVQSKAQSFAAFLDRAAKAFSNLSDSSKTAILGTAAGLVAIGPALKVIGTVKQIYAEFLSNVKSGLQTIKNLSGKVLEAAAAYQKLSLAQKATIAGFAIAGIAAAVLIIQKLTSELSNAEKIQRNLAEVNNAAAASIAKEKFEAAALIKVIQSETATREAKVKALEKLNSVGGEYFRGLSIEKSSVNEITTAYDKYIANLLKAAKAQAAQQKIVELEKQRLDLAQKLSDFQNEDFLTKAGAGLVDFVNVTKRQIADLEEQQKRLSNIAFDPAEIIKPASSSGSFDLPKIATAGGTSAQRIELEVIPKLTTGFDANSLEGLREVVKNQIDKSGLFDFSESPFVSNAEGIINPLIALDQQIALINSKSAVFGNSFDAIAEKINVTQTALNNAIENGFDPYGQKVEILTERLAILQEAQSKQVQQFEKINAVTAVLYQPFQDLFSTLAEGGGNAFQSFADSLKKIIKQLAVAAATAAALQVVIGAITGGGSLAAGGFRGGFASLFQQFGGFKIPRFATGTNFAPGGLALVGERGPELVNLPRGSQVIPNNRLSMGGANVNVTVGGEFRMSRGEMVLFIEEAMRYAGRTSGR